MINPNNKLHNETSPYLQQHADNPVNWYPWGPEALELARAENKPILLSIGYSACHWCHVMAHESFEDNKTAQLMNSLFINIKIDREERPDLDKIYQAAHSILTGRPGGWPLTVFLSPDNQLPFFAGTYFPPEQRYQMPAFADILTMTSEAYVHRQDEIHTQDSSLKDMLKNMSGEHSLPASQLSSLGIDLCRKQLAVEYKPQYGGFSGAPKFPHPSMLERAIRHWALTHSQGEADDHILDIAFFSLEQMALGGLFDQLGGGFYRYSTDDQWMIPHFEKMLYDNSQLLSLYTQAWKISHHPVFKHTTEYIADWVIREMQSPNGGYFSALDADLDGVEGKFYVWQKATVKQLLSEQDYPIYAQCYGLDREPNFEGAWHLHTFVPAEKLTKQFQQTETEIHDILNRCHQQLFIERSKRKTPGRDEKILTSWNALMIRAMTLTGRTFENSRYIDSANAALDFLYAHLWQNHRLLATSKDGKSHLNAYLDDYAYLLQALLECLQTEWRNDHLNWAIEIANTLLNYFEDSQQGGFYFTSHDHEQLIQRSKSFADDAMPSGNGVAALALQQLGLLLGETRYLNAAENCLKAGTSQLQAQAITHCSLIHALEEHLNLPTIIILRGNVEQTNHWQQLIQSPYLQGVYCFAIPHDIQLPASLSGKHPQGDICAYICQGTQCLSPVTELHELESYILPHICQQLDEA